MANHRQKNRRRVFGVEALEERALLAVTAEVFTGPSLAGVIAAAWRGKNTSGAAIRMMTGALESQFESGPLADLKSGAVDGNGFVQEAQSLVASFDQNVDQQLLPHFVNIDQMIKLQAQSVLAQLVAANQEESVGLISSAGLQSAAETAISSLTAGPIHALRTPVSAYVAATQTLENNLSTLVQTLSTTATTPLSVTQVATTLTAEAEAYRAEVHAGAQVTHPQVSSAVDSAVNTLETTAAAIAAANDSTTAQADFQAAIAAFDTAVLDTTGIFGPQGRVNRTVARLGYLPATPTTPGVGLPATTISSVSGTATDGVATLTATLDSGGSPVSGALVSFTLDGAFAGVALTDSTGVATLSGIATTDTGTVSGAVFASFGGNSQFQGSTGIGDLTSSTPTTPAATALGSVAGTATVGGTATLTATLIAMDTGDPIPNATVNFTLDGTSVGSATTDASGVATLSGVATTAGAGTDTGGVGASFAGDSQFQASSATGDLVVSSAATSTLASVGGTSTFGGSATLTATLTAGGQPVAGQTVNFTLSGTSVGSAVTDANGVATLGNVATTADAGTITGAVVASYPGDSGHTAASGSGDMVVSQSATTLANVGATANFGSTATLTATLTSQTTGQPVAGQTVGFTLDGASVGTAVTDSNGVATLAGIATSDAAGVHTGAVVASYGGSANFLASANAGGDLTVNPAATSFSAVSGTATGGVATLTATLTSQVTQQGIANQTVSFVLDGISVGTATTDANGVATLDNVPTTDSSGTHTGVVVVSYAGGGNFAAAANGTGDLVVS